MIVGGIIINGSPNIPGGTTKVVGSIHHNQVGLSCDRRGDIDPLRLTTVDWQWLESLGQRLKLEAVDEEAADSPAALPETEG
jgi:hypothetical protein